MNWTEYFINIAWAVSLKSKDRSVKVGAIVVGPDHEIRTTGYNGFPRDVNDDIEKRHHRPTKYVYTAHAEANCVANAAMSGISLKECTMYLNFAPPPCSECTKMVINAGILQIVGPDIQFTGKKTLQGPRKDWSVDFNDSIEMLDERKVHLVTYYPITELPILGV